MKRFLASILVFFCIVAAVDLLAGFAGDYLWTHAKGGLTEKTHSLVARGEHDVLVFGSSRAHCHYDTPYMSDTLGVDCFNAGYDGNGIILAYGLLEQITERHTPRLVIYDASRTYDVAATSYDKDNTLYLDFLKPYYRNSAVGSIFKDVSKEAWHTVHSGLIRYNSKYTHMLFDYLDDTKEAGGFSPLRGSLGEDYTPGEQDPSGYTVDSLKLKYIRKFIGLTREKGFRLSS